MKELEYLGVTPLHNSHVVLTHPNKPQAELCLAGVDDTEGGFLRWVVLSHNKHNTTFQITCLYSKHFCISLSRKFKWVAKRRDECILRDPGESRGEGKSKQEEKYGTKKSKERQEEPLGTTSYQTSSKWSPPFFVPYFSSHLDFPSPLLSTPGSPRMGWMGMEGKEMLVHNPHNTEKCVCPLMQPFLGWCESVVWKAISSSLLPLLPFCCPCATNFVQ